MTKKTDTLSTVALVIGIIWSIILILWGSTQETGKAIFAAPLTSIVFTVIGYFFGTKAGKTTPPSKGLSIWTLVIGIILTLIGSFISGILIIIVGISLLNQRKNYLNDTPNENAEIPIDGSERGKFYCVRCGKKLEDNAIFCVYCGVKQNE